MTYGEAYRSGIQILTKSNIDAPAVDAGVLLCFTARCDRVFLYAHGDDELNEALFQQYLSMLAKRAAGYPLQYLTGTQEFMSLPFRVERGVLIPRHETELLVEVVINFCTSKLRKGCFCGECDCEDHEDHEDRCRILDIGTGSGCIAVSLAYYLPGCDVTAVDKAAGALDVARANARANGVSDRVLFVESDLFDSLSDVKYDVIVSNPPYIRSEDITKLQREVGEYEPAEALDGGADGLRFYRKIIQSAPRYLKDGGILAFETGYDQAHDVSGLISDEENCRHGDFSLYGHFNDITVHSDISGIDRVVTGRYTKEGSFT